MASPLQVARAQSPRGRRAFCRDDAGPPWNDAARPSPGRARSFDAGARRRPRSPAGGECPAPLKAACDAKGAKAAHLDGPVDCGGDGWFWRILDQPVWRNREYDDRNFAYCNASDADERDDDGHCHGGSDDSTYGWWIRDHYFRGYAGAARCCGRASRCTGPPERARRGARCDYRRYVERRRGGQVPRRERGPRPLVRGQLRGALGRALRRSAVHKARDLLDGAVVRTPGVGVELGGRRLRGGRGGRVEEDDDEDEDEDEEDEWEEDEDEWEEGGESCEAVYHHVEELYEYIDELEAVEVEEHVEGLYEYIDELEEELRRATAGSARARRGRGGPPWAATTDDDCSEGRCNAEDVCLSNCKEGEMCPTVCMGWCVKKDEEEDEGEEGECEEHHEYIEELEAHVDELEEEVEEMRMQLRAATCRDELKKKKCQKKSNKGQCTKNKGARRKCKATCSEKTGEDLCAL